MLDILENTFDNTKIDRPISSFNRYYRWIVAIFVLGQLIKSQWV